MTKELQELLDKLIKLALESDRDNLIVLHAEHLPDVYRKARATIEHGLYMITGRYIAFTVEPPTDKYPSGTLESRYSAGAKPVFGDMFL